MRTLPAIVISAALATLALGAFAARRPPHGGTIRLPTEGPIASLDPTQALWPDEVGIASLLFDSPLRLGRDGRTRPLLLSSPQDEGDGRTLRFRVREHAIFNDGTPMRAKHVSDSLRRLAASRSAGSLLAMVEGAALGRPPSGISAQGERTVVIRLNDKRSSSLLSLSLATPQAGIVRSAAKAARGVGSGPFALQSSRGIDRVLRRNGDYFHGPPFLEGITLLAPADRGDHIRRFQLGRADGSLLGDSLYGERSPRGKVVVTEGPRAYLACLVVNGGRGRVESAPLRRAIGLAISRDRIAGDTGRSAGLPGAKAPPRRNLAKARRAITAAGGMGRPLVLLVHGEDSFGEAMAPLIVRDLGEAGLGAETAILTGSAARARITAGSWDLRLVTVSPPSPDAVIQLSQLLSLGGQREEAFRLMRRAGIDRQGELARAARALDESAFVLPLVQRAPRLYHDPRLRGVAYDAVGRLLVSDLWVNGPGEGGGG